MKSNTPKKRRRGFKLGPKGRPPRLTGEGGPGANLTVLAPGVAEGADSWGPTGLRNLGSGEDCWCPPYDPEDDPADQPPFDGAGHWDDDDNPHPDGYSPREVHDLKEEIRHTRGSWASGWGDRSRK